jgi:hypothetical protein
VNDDSDAVAQVVRELPLAGPKNVDATAAHVVALVALSAADAMAVTK